MEHGVRHPIVVKMFARDLNLLHSLIIQELYDDDHAATGFLKELDLCMISIVIRIFYLFHFINYLKYLFENYYKWYII